MNLLEVRFAILKIGFLGLSLWGQPFFFHSAWANSNPSFCEHNLESRSHAMEKWKKQVDLPLPAAVVARLQSDPFLKDHWIRKTKGELIGFVLPYMKEPRDGSGKGEWIQTIFLKKVLKIYFPKAEFFLKSSDVPLAYTPIELDVIDLAETEESFEVDTIDMVSLKGANWGSATLGQTEVRNEIRADLGIPETERALSLYIYGGSKACREKRWSLGEAVKSTGTSVIFLSINGEDDTDIDHLSFLKMEFSSSFFTVLSLKHLKRGELAAKLEEAKKENRVLVILNDTLGYVPYLHAAADAAGIVGPINFFEALQVGTPTAVFRDKAGHSFYNAGEFRSLVQLGKSNGTLIQARSYSEFWESLGGLIQTRRLNPQVVMQNWDENPKADPWKRLLKEITRAILNQLQ